MVLSSFTGHCSLLCVWWPGCLNIIFGTDIPHPFLSFWVGVGSQVKTFFGSLYFLSLKSSYKWKLTMSFLITLADRGDSVEGDGFGWVFVYFWLFEGKEIVFSENEWSPLCRGRGTCAMFLIFWTICLRSHCGWFIRAIFLEISSSTPSIEVTIIISWVVNSVVKAIQ